MSTPEMSTSVSPETLANAIAQAPESVFLIDPDGTFAYANAAFCELLGRSADAIVGSPLTLLQSERNGQDFFDDLMTVLRANTTWNGPIISAKAGGELFQREWSISAIRENDKVQYYRGIAQSVEQDAGSEAKARQSQKMEAIGQLASGIAHEINTPTQYIGDNLQFFQESTNGIRALLDKYEELIKLIKAGEDPAGLIAEIEEFADEIDLEFLTEETPGAIDRALEGNHRVAEVVRAMKEFAHPSAEEMTPTDINRAIRNTISVARNEWKYVADVDAQLDENLPPVTCLPGAINQVFLNMLVNAAHAIEDVVGDGTSEKGTITISTSADGEMAEIRISDTGCGIPEENIQRVFNPFFTTKEIGKGTGQGLSIAHAVVVDTHGGTLDIESEVGKGTTFIIRVPLRGVGNHSDG